MHIIEYRLTNLIRNESSQFNPRATNHRIISTWRGANKNICLFMESLSFIQDLLGPYLIMIRVQSAGEDKIKNFANYQIQF